MKLIARIMIAVMAVVVCNTVMASEKPLKVYILAGQSNMQGSAHFSTFKAIGDDPETTTLLCMILDRKGDPVVCDNAWISYLTQQDECDTVLQGRVKVGYGFDHERIGPEYAFGLFMDKAHSEPVLIIKTAWGGMTRREARKERERYGFADGGLTREEQSIWDRCASNAEYHYLGSGKTFVRFGKALAEAMLGMEKN